MSTREDRRADALEGFDPSCIGCHLGICTLSHDEGEPCPGCPYAACLGCQWQGSNDVGTQGILWDNGSGRDERPAASTADRSSHSDSHTRKEGVGSW